MRIHQCRSCQSRALKIVLDLGEHPVSNALLNAKIDAAREKRYPLQLAFCEGCSLLQVTETVSPEELYQRDYPYFSSSSPALLQHAASVADRLTRRFELDEDSFVIEVACNDGYLLRNFVNKNIPCLGIDPAEGPVNQAAKIGIPVIHGFFSSAVAEQLVAEGKSADLVIANNVVAHVDAINDFVAGFAKVLKPRGTAVFEFAYAVDMIENCEFDTIYHEHLFYHTLHGLIPLFGRHGLHLNDVERLPIHGGSLRLFVSRQAERSDRLDQLMNHELTLGVGSAAYYEDFSGRVSQLKHALVELLKDEKQHGARIACYGAAAKGGTLVNYLDLGPDFFDYVADANPHKQGKYMPGQLIPVVHPDLLSKTQPDLVLLLVWNFAGEVLRQQSAYRAAGGRFVIPVPRPHLIEPEDAIADTHFALANGTPAPDASRTADALAVSA